MLLTAAIALSLAASFPAVVGEADVDPPAARRSSAEARFLRVRAALASGAAAAADRELPGLATALPAIADRVEALAAAAAEAMGEPDRALEIWGRIPSTSLLWPRARMSIGRLHAAAGRGAEAVLAVRPLVGLAAPGDLSREDPAPRALLFAGKVLSEQPGGESEARRMFLDCWAGHALAPEAKECRARLDALPLPGGAPPGDEDLLRRAEALLDWNRNEQALAEAKRVGERLPSPGADAPLACRAGFVRGKALRKLRQHALAAEELAPVVEVCTDPALRPRALYLLAVTRANVNNAAGVEVYRRFAAEYPEHAQSDDALFFASDLLVRDGRVEEARRLLDELVERYPDGDFRADALFKGAWLAWRQGDLDGAVAGMARLENLYRERDPYEHARAVYWRGRVLSVRKGRGDLERARTR